VRLEAKTPELLAKDPIIEQVDLLAVKLTSFQKESFDYRPKLSSFIA
jgi:hypothetical protein